MFAFNLPGSRTIRPADDRLSHARADCWKADRDFIRKEFAALVRYLRGLLRS
ncbi:MAG: hypothetical protein HY521_03370 [Proteobacteria bacterium]|nr:hypothetical protein [Pseudomonadota bacterium]